MKVVKAHNGQNLFDVALSQYGTIEAVYELTRANNLSITAELIAGQLLNIPDISYPDYAHIVSYLKANKIVPTSGNILVGTTTRP